MENKICPTINGVCVLYSWVNQAYFVMWLDLVLAIKNEKEEALALYRDLTGQKLS